MSPATDRPALTLDQVEDPTAYPAIWVRVEDLDPWQENPRTYSPEVIRSLAELVLRHGFNMTIGAHWPTRRLRSGHRRRLALRLIWAELRPGFTIAGAPGPRWVPVRFRGGEWDGPDGAEGDALADNRAQEDGVWDADGVAGILNRWHRDGAEIAELAASTAFMDAEVRTYIDGWDPTTADPGSVDPPPAPRPPREPDSVRGRVYRLGPHILYCGDSTDLDNLREGLGEAFQADAVITDPPYAIYGSATGLEASVADDKMVRPFFRGVLHSAKALIKPWAHVYVCCDWRSWASWWEVAKLVKLAPSNLLIWDKGNSGLGSSWANSYELIGFWTNRPPRLKMFRAQTGVRTVLRANMLRIEVEGDDGPARVPLLDADRLEALAELAGGDVAELRRLVEAEHGRRALLTYGRVTGAERVHNSAKPIALLEELIDAATDPDQTVLDLFGGGGSTLLAAARTNRRAVLVEIDPLWCDVIRHRWTLWAQDAGIEPGPDALVIPDGPQVLGADSGKGKGKSDNGGDPPGPPPAEHSSRNAALYDDDSPPPAEPVRQPAGRSLCGQATVATLAGVDLETARRAVGKGGKTSTKDLGRGLAALGYQLGDRRRHAQAGKPAPELPTAGRWVGRLVYPDHTSHWIAVWSGRILDPARGSDPDYSDKFRITSLWPVGRSVPQEVPADG